MSIKTQVIAAAVKAPQTKVTVTLPYVTVGSAIRRQFKQQLSAFSGTVTYREAKYMFSSDLHKFTMTGYPEEVLGLIIWLESL